MAGPPPPVLAVAGGKGGCGKTTVALGLARAMARDGRRPLVADADVAGPDLHRRAGTDRVPDLADVAAGRDPAAVAHPDPGTDGLGVLPAPGPGGADDVGTALRQVARCDRPAVVDCPAGSGPAAATPLRAADRAVVVATPRRPGVRGAAAAARMARGLGTAVAGVVVTGTDRAPPAASALEPPVLACVPPDVRVRRASYEQALAAL